jgi:prophage regulatory protein
MQILSYSDLQTIKRVPYCRDHVRRLEKAGAFPRRVFFGSKKYGWIESEIDDWIAARVRDRDAKSSKVVA